MNITQNLKSLLNSFNNKVNPTTVSEPLDECIIFQFGEQFDIISSLTDVQMEAFILMLTNDVGLEFILQKLSIINPVQFEKVISSIKLKNLENEYLEKEDPDEPIVPVVARNE